MEVQRYRRNNDSRSYKISDLNDKGKELRKDFIEIDSKIQELDAVRSISIIFNTSDSNYIQPTQIIV